MKTTVKDSTAKKIRTKKPQNQWNEKEIYTEPRTGDRKWISEKALKALGREAIEWYKAQPKAIKLTQFCEYKDISYATWRDWVEKYDWFYQTQQFIKMIIGNRREKGMVFLDEGQRETPNLRAMHFYDEDWRGMDKYHSDLKKTEEDTKGSGTIVVEIKKPESYEEQKEK